LLLLGGLGPRGTQESAGSQPSQLRPAPESKKSEGMHRAEKAETDFVRQADWPPDKTIVPNLRLGTRQRYKVVRLLNNFTVYFCSGRAACTFAQQLPQDPLVVPLFSLPFSSRRPLWALLAYYVRGAPSCVRPPFLFVEE
jgi:hypothetical protein